MYLSVFNKAFFFPDAFRRILDVKIVPLINRKNKIVL